MEGKIILDNADDSKPKRKRAESPQRPDFLDPPTASKATELDVLNQRIDDSKKHLNTVEESNDFDHKRIKVQIDVMELIVCSQTFERFSNNISIHASNIRIHAQTIKNTAGIVDQMNRQNKAIKALMQTVNHLINVTNSEKIVGKVQGIDVERREGAISILDAYKAMEETKELLEDELLSFTHAIDDQLKRVDSVRAAARLVPNLSIQVSAWLDKSIEPLLIARRKEALVLRADFVAMSRIEPELRLDLANEKADDL